MLALQSKSRWLEPHLQQSYPRHYHRVATGQGKVREILNTMKVREFHNFGLKYVL